MNRTAEIIKQTLTMREVAEWYGFYPDRAGFINCPLQDHPGDHTASMKLYPDKGGGFYCFGCKAHGSVIDFVMQIEGVPFKTAMERLNSAFHLGLTKQTYREKKASRNAFMEAQRRLREEAERTEEIERQYWAAFDRWRVADMMAIHYSPSEAGGAILPGYAEAVKILPQLSYELHLAEARRSEFENASRHSGLGKRTISDDGTL